MDKKTEILLAAKERFAEYGFQQVSMQSIAEACKISKASIYKFFQSKEELLSELIKYNHQQMMKQASMVNNDDTLSDEAKFEEKLVIEIQSFKENKHLIQMLMFSPPFKESKDMEEHMNNVRAVLLKWHQQMLLDLYGERIRPILWDLTMNALGLLNPYMKMSADGVITVDPHVIAREIRSLLSAIIDAKADHPAILDERNMHLRYYADMPGLKSKEQLVEMLIEEMEAIIANFDKESDRKDFSAALHHLKESLQNKPEDYLITALLHYLAEKQTLISHVQSLRVLLQRRK